LAFSDREWDEFNEGLSWEIVRRLRAQLSPEKYMTRLQELRNMSEKFVYYFLIHEQPQTFTGVKRRLRLPDDTVDRALKGLIAKGLILVDDRFRYWVKEL